MSSSIEWSSSAAHSASIVPSLGWRLPSSIWLMVLGESCALSPSSLSGRLPRRLLKRLPSCALSRADSRPSAGNRELGAAEFAT